MKLVLVDAPAGFGKTTVVAQWRSSALESRSFAWISLDRGDDDPARLWWYIVSALQRACPQIGVEALLKELRVQAPEVTGTVLPVLANELAALPAPVVLVLDDYHVIKERSCHEQIEFLLQHLPPSAQIVLITRADPPLPLARLRAAGEMIEIRARELRFAPEEAAALVQAVADVRLSEADLADLMERTEGWPAGVYLAALSLRGHPSPQAFVREFTGDNRFIVDFLADEVLSRQPGEIRQFLARTSILGRFCAPLCDAVTGSANAADIIETLERENLFLVPLDDNRQWYRYHHLFAQLLRSQLAMDRAGQRALPAPAGERLAPAVGLGRRGDQPRAGGGRHRRSRRSDRALLVLLRGHRPDGDGARVDALARRRPDRHSPAGRALRGLGRGSHRRPGNRAPLAPAHRGGPPEGPLPDGMQSLRSSAALLRGVFGFDGLRVMRESAATAADLECDPASPWYALARAALGFSLYLSGDPEAAAGPLEEAVQSESSIPLIRMYALSAMTLVAVELGRVSKAQDFAQAARVARQPQRLPHVTAERRGAPRDGCGPCRAGPARRKPAASSSRSWKPAAGSSASARGPRSNCCCCWPGCGSTWVTGPAPRNWPPRRGTC